MTLDLPTDWLPGYELIRLLSAAGGRQVYLARQAALARPVVLKVLTGVRLDESGWARFEREREASLCVREPHVVTLLDAGIHEQMPYLVFEYLEGPTLAQVLADRGRLAPAEAADLAAQALEGLAAVHEAGIVHRDIKPANLLAGAGGHIRVLDLGIGRIEGAMALTRPGEFLGTPAYTAPEMVTGGPVGPAADVYSVGVVLYESVSGVNPFRTGDVATELARQCNLVPPPPGPGVPRALSDLIMAMLDKDPARRPTPASVLAGSLRAAATAGEEDPARTARARETTPDAGGPPPEAAMPGAGPATRVLARPHTPSAQHGGERTAAILVAALLLAGIAALHALLTVTPVKPRPQGSPPVIAAHQVDRLVPGGAFVLDVSTAAPVRVVRVTPPATVSFPTAPALHHRIILPARDLPGAVEVTLESTDGFRVRKRIRLDPSRQVRALLEAAGDTVRPRVRTILSRVARARTPAAAAEAFRSGWASDPLARALLDALPLAALFRDPSLVSPDAQHDLQRVLDELGHLPAIVREKGIPVALDPDPVRLLPFPPAAPALLDAMRPDPVLDTPRTIGFDPMMGLLPGPGDRMTLEWRPSGAVADPPAHVVVEVSGDCPEVGRYFKLRFGAPRTAPDEAHGPRAPHAYLLRPVRQPWGGCRALQAVDPHDVRRPVTPLTLTLLARDRMPAIGTLTIQRIAVWTPRAAPRGRAPQ